MGQPSKRSILPDDPMVRWIVWLCIFISIGVPVVLALLLELVH